MPEKNSSYWGGPKGMLAPPSQIIGGPAAPPPPPPPPLPTPMAYLQVTAIRERYAILEADCKVTFEDSKNIFLQRYYKGLMNGIKLRKISYFGFRDMLIMTELLDDFLNEETILRGSLNLNKYICR